MEKEYYSCRFIETGLVFAVDKLLLCCLTNHGRGCPQACDFHGGELPVERILAFREEVRIQNQQPGHYPLCEGCGFLIKKKWENQAYAFSHITLAHFTHCNLACNYCYVTKDGFLTKPAKGYDVYHILKKMIQDRQLSPHSKIAWGGGEPTIYPDFERVFQLLLDFGVYQDVATNGTVMSPVLKEALLKGKAGIICSVDAGTPETYQKIKNQDFFQKVWHNLAEYAKTNGRVAAKIIVTQENCHEIMPFIDMVERAHVLHIIYEVDFHNQHQPDEIMEAIALLIHECSIKRGIYVFEAGGGVASFGDDLRSRIKEYLDRSVTWEEFLKQKKTIDELQEHYKTLQHLEKSYQRLQQNYDDLQQLKAVRFSKGLAKYPRLAGAAKKGFSYLEKFFSLFK